MDEFWIFVSLVLFNECSCAITMTRDLKNLLTDLHNDYRRDVQPEAANMQKLTWNTTLERKAGAWVDRCGFEHQSKGLGENLYYNTAPSAHPKLIRGGLKVWFDERSTYTFGSKSCGRACHYTQMVWATTTAVGCGVKRCRRLTAFGRTINNAWYIACFYAPQGNWIGRKPYEEGQKCSMCIPGQTCDNGLCTGKGRVPCIDGNANCNAWQRRGECRRNPNWMLKNCRKACGVCTEENNNTDTNTIPDVIIPIEEDVTRTCKDRATAKRCKYWKSKGSCLKKTKYMRKQCQRTCKFCSDGIHLCEDSIGCCAELGRSSCRKYPTFMAKHCQKTCDRC